MGDLGGLGVGGPSARVGELLVELVVAFHGPLLASALGRGHLVLSLANARDDRVDAAHRDDAIAGLHLWVTDVSVLREVADGAVGADGSGVLGRSPAVGFAGDAVLVDMTRRAPNPPGIFVLDDGMGLVAKRLEHIPNSDPPAVRVISDNKHYPEYERTADEIHIVGRIRWFAREI